MKQEDKAVLIKNVVSKINPDKYFAGVYRVNVQAVQNIKQANQKEYVQTAKFIYLLMILAGIFSVFCWIFDPRNLMYFVFGAIFILFCILILFSIKPDFAHDIGYINDPRDLLEAKLMAIGLNNMPYGLNQDLKNRFKNAMLFDYYCGLGFQIDKLFTSEAKVTNNKLETLCEAMVNKELHGNDVSDEYKSLTQNLSQYVMQLCIKLENLPSSSMYEGVVKNIIKYKKYKMLPDDIRVQFNCKKMR